MKKLFSRMFDTLPKRIIAGATIALAFAFPVAVSAAQTVAIEASTGVANVTAGDTSYGSSTNATYNQVVKVEVVYDNDEAAGSGKTANNLHVKINIPTTAGTSQTIATTTSADNSNTVNGSVKVNLDNSSEYLQYIPGTAVWVHAKSATSTQTVTQTISDAVVTGANGLVLENENPCQAGSVTVQARVMMPGVKITKQSEILGQSNQWSANNTAQAGDTMKYLITYENDGNTTESNVVIRDTLPAGMTLVPNTTEVYTSSTPNGSLDTTNNITGGGLNIGGYLPGAIAYVELEAKLPAASAMTCGENTFQNTGMATPQGMEEYYNYAVTMVNNQCTPTQPTYTCNTFTLTPGDKRTVTVSKFDETATNGATFNDVVINWGDNTTPLTTNSPVGQTHQYASYGTPYTVTATAHFTVNGQDVTATNECTQTLTFATPSTPTTPTTPTTTTSAQLPNTGAGNVIGLFVGASLVSAIGYRLFLARRLTRQ